MRFRHRYTFLSQSVAKSFDPIKKKKLWLTSPILHLKVLILRKMMFILGIHNYMCFYFQSTWTRGEGVEISVFCRRAPSIFAEDFMRVGVQRTMLLVLLFLNISNSLQCDN